MNAFMKIVLVVCAVIFASSLAALLILRPPSPKTGVTTDTAELGPFDPYPGYEQLHILPITLETHDGRTIDESVFDGRVTLVDFVFTDCVWICPTLTGAMKILDENLADADVRLLSISVNPERDTRERLAGYAEKFDAEAPRWTFARGDKEAIWKFCEQGLKFAVAPDPGTTVTAADGTVVENIRHPSWIALVGPDRRVLGVYRSSDDADLARLEKRARTLTELIAKGEGPVPPAGG